MGEAAERCPYIVCQSDIPTLLSTAAGEWSETAVLSVSLLRAFAARPDVSRDSAVRLISTYAKADDFTGAVAGELLG